MVAPETRAKIERELAQAEKARSMGNEGMARVCARRAAGAAIDAFFLSREQPVRTASAMDLLNQLRRTPGLPERVYQVVDHLLMRVNPDYELPVPVDLIAETRQLVQDLEQYQSPGQASRQQP